MLWARVRFAEPVGDAVGEGEGGSIGPVVGGLVTGLQWGWGFPGSKRLPGGGASRPRPLRRSKAGERG